MGHEGRTTAPPRCVRARPPEAVPAALVGSAAASEEWALEPKNSLQTCATGLRPRGEEPGSG